MSPASHVVRRFRRLYGIVLGRMRSLQGGRPARRIRNGQALGGLLEPLEPRLLLSGTLQFTHVVYALPGNRPAGSQDLSPLSSSSPVGLTATQIETAYGLVRSIVGYGAGQTIAIVDAYDDPDLVNSSDAGYLTSDLHYFNVAMGLSDFGGSGPTFQKLGQNGSPTALAPPSGTSQWSLEECLDIEWAHVIAPLANIVLVEGNSASEEDLVYSASSSSALDTARHLSGVSVVSMSFGRSEDSSDTTEDPVFTTPAGHAGITFVASTGDSGAPGDFPAYSPNVLAVGGTKLTLGAGNSYGGETGWSGSGGGQSTVEAEPGYQLGVQSSGWRQIPDVSFDADPSSGVAVYDSYDYSSAAPWIQVGGTSLAAPCWGGLIALADQMRVAVGAPTLDGPSQTLPSLYALPATDWHDVTSGSNNGFSATAGYDRVTGIGTPVANLLVPHLALGLKMTVVGSTPSNGSIVSSPPSDFVVTFSDAYLPASIDASDLTVNGVAADSFTLTDATTVTFHYIDSPAATQGLETLSIAAGAVLRSSDNGGNSAWSASFRYDAILLAVASTDPASDSVVTLPLTYLQLNFDEAVGPASIGAGDLTLSQGSVVSAAMVGANSVGYTLAGVTNEGTFTFSLPAGAVTDAWGNPGAAYSGSFALDAGTLPYPTPLTPLAPPGSLIYDPSVAGMISPAGDTDSFTISLDAGQTLTALVTPAAGLQPTVQIAGPGGAVLGSASAAGAGKLALAQTVPVASAGTYTVTVGSLGGTAGQYTLQATLNAALESQSNGGAANDTPATAQGIDGSFIGLGAGASRGAVLGASDLPAGALPAEVEPNDSTGQASAASFNFAAYSGNLYHLGIKGSVSTSTDADWFKLGPMDVADVITVSESGSPSSRGTLSDSYVYLYRYNGGSPVQVAYNDDGGPGLDSLIYRYSVSADDVYYLVADGYGANTGSYDLGVWLENAGAAPATGGTRTGETEANDSVTTANDASTSWRPVQYFSQTAGAIATSGDVDYYAFQFTAGDLVSTSIAAVAGLYARSSLLNSAGAVVASDDGTGSGPSPNSALYAYLVPTTGTYYLQAAAYAGTGAYTASVYLSTSAPPPIGSVSPDFYSFTLSAGDTVSLGLTALSTGSIHLALADAAGTVLATGVTGATNLTEAIHSFQASSGGTYYARVTGVSSSVPYSLVVTRNVEFAAEPNHTPASAQEIGPSGQVLGALGGTGQAYYQVSVHAGDLLKLSTRTPGDGPYQFANALDPSIELYDPGGTWVASDDNHGPDGRNALLSYTAPADGTYEVRVLAASGSGEYVLTVAGASGAGPAFVVAATDPASGALLRAAPTTVTVDFNRGVLLTSLQASDLTVDGLPATGFTLVDGNTVTFTLPAGTSGGGTHKVAIGAGAILDLRGGLVQAYSGQYVLDTTPPRVIASSIQENGAVPGGGLSYVAQFSKPMQTANLDAADFSLQGTYAGGSYSAASFSYDPAGTTLTLTYASLPDDRYTLTLLSGDGEFEDTIGNDLDGEPAAWPIPPHASGNGIEGGDFVVHFVVDSGPAAMPIPLAPANPDGSLIYGTSAATNIACAGDTDSFTISLDAGQTLTALVTPAAGLQPTVQVAGPGGTVLGSAAAAAAGKRALVQTVPVSSAGTYTVTVGSLGATAGPYTVQATLNAALELESYDGTGNDAPATAQNIDGSFVALGAGASRGAVLGTSDVGAASLPAEAEPNNTLSQANSAAFNFAAYSGNLYQLGIKGSIAPSDDSDWIKLGPMDVGDVLTITVSGSPSSRGTLYDPYLYLYRYHGGSPVRVATNDDGGPGYDSLIYRYSVSAADTYYAVTSSYFGLYSGTYDLGVWLENAGTAPATGGARTSESEPNDSVGAATDASTSWRPVQYRSQTTGAITSGDTDCFAFLFTAGDLVSLNVAATGGLHARSWLMNSGNNPIASEDGTSTGPSPSSPIYAVAIPTTGTYYLEVMAASGTGSYTASVYLSTTSPPPVASPGSDFYAVTLSAGDTASLGLTALSTGAIHLALTSAAGSVLATGVVGATNLTEAIHNFLVPASATYYARVTGVSSPLPYSLVVTRNADFDTEPDNAQASAQPMQVGPGLGTAAVLGQVGIGGDSDYFSLQARAGTLLTLATATPGGGPNQFANALDPMIELYDPSGTRVAWDDNHGADGRNALLAYTPAATGRYVVRVLAAGGTAGEYTLIAAASAEVAGRYVFYNRSAFDNNDPGANASDDAAIAPDKQALLPGQTATFANYTSYSRGINGILVDITALADPGDLTLANIGKYFTFHVGNDKDTGSWNPAPAPSAVLLRQGAGAGGSDRVEILWTDNAIQNTWLQVTVLSGAEGGLAGLAADDVFYWGNALGESGDSRDNAVVDQNDADSARADVHGPFSRAGITDAHDYNRDRLVNAADIILARDNPTTLATSLRLITAPEVAGPAVEAMTVPVRRTSADVTVVAAVPPPAGPTGPTSADTPDLTSALASPVEADAESATDTIAEAQVGKQGAPASAPGVAQPALADRPGAGETAAARLIPPPAARAGSASANELPAIPALDSHRAGLAGPAASGAAEMPAIRPGRAEGTASANNYPVPGPLSEGLLVPLEDPLAIDVLAGLRLLNTW